MVTEPKENLEKDVKESCCLYVLNKSTQGIELTRNNDGNIRLHIPFLASREDVELGFDIMRLIRVKDPSIIIQKNESSEQADLSKEEEIDIYYYRLDNMASLIEKQDDVAAVMGKVNHFFIYPKLIKSSLPNVEPIEWTFKAYEDFRALQWDYQEYPLLSTITIGATDSEETFEAKSISNSKCFARECEIVCLKDESTRGIKIIPIEDFLEGAKECKYITRLDYTQFIIDKMPDEEWQKLFDKFDVEIISGSHRCYLLRWNPTFSSFKLSEYQRLLKEIKPGQGIFIDWSIYEYEQAKKGDRFYMLRTGDDKAGIVFKGFFETNPYKGEDWAGTSKVRYYVDILGLNPSGADSPAHISIEELENAIPDINWRKGHSGELLTEEQAEILNQLWINKVGDMIH